MVNPIDVTPYVATITDSTNTTPPAQATTGANATWYALQAADYSNGIVFLNDGTQVLHVLNTSANIGTITAIEASACDQGYTSEHNVPATIAVGNVTPKVKILGGFAPSRFNQTIDPSGANLPNRCKITFSISGSAGLSIMVVTKPTTGQ